MYIVVTCDDDYRIKADQLVTHQRGLHATVAFVLEIGGVEFVTSTFKNQIFVADSTVPVSVLPRTLIQTPVWLACSKRHVSNAFWSLTIPLHFAPFAAS